MPDPRHRHIGPYFERHEHRHWHHVVHSGAIRNTLDTAPNLELIRLRYADVTDNNGNFVRHGAEFDGFFSKVDKRVFTKAGAPQALGDFYRWGPITTTH